MNAAPEPAIVLTTDRQLKDVARFCMSYFEFSPLIVDPTFCLGEFDVTLITYLSSLPPVKKVQFTNSVCRSMLYKKSFATYLFFASSVIGQCRQLVSVHVIGTDGEQALIGTFKHEFGYAQNLTCFFHVRRNVKDKLHQCLVPAQVSTSISLAKKVGTVYTEGLVDASDTIDFDKKTRVAVERWKTLALSSSANMDQFISWFLNHKAMGCVRFVDTRFVDFLCTSIPYSQPQTVLGGFWGAEPPVLAFSLGVLGLVSQEYDVLVFSV